MARNGAPLRYPSGAAMTPSALRKAPRRTEPRLDSWKEIASYLGRGIRTVQRWEREEGLPVHRLDHAKRGSVYADPTELTAWWESRRRSNAAPTPTTRPRHLPRDAASQRVTSYGGGDILAGAFVRRAHGRVRLRCGKDGESPQVWLQQIGGAAVQLTTGLRDCAEPAFSADDTRVTLQRRPATRRGTSTRFQRWAGRRVLVKRAARNARFSPDGKWLAYIALEPRDTIRLAPTNGGEERTLASGLVDIASATWSDDSRHLLVHRASESVS